MNSTDGRPPLWERQPWDTNVSYKYYLPAEEPDRLIKAYQAYRREISAKPGLKRQNGMRPPSCLW